MTLYRFHGWFGISTDVTSPEGEDVEPAIATIQAAVEALDWDNGEAQLRAFNGSYFLYMLGAGNRPRDFPADVERLLDVVSSAAPGSYGLLYSWDDELAGVAGNMFQVQVMTRGLLTPHGDPFLSPVVPILSDD
jgi:hypothetical protein